MTNRESLYRSLSRAAWGYFFLNFDFNIGTVSLFPRFVGYILFFLAIETLAEERRDLRLLRPLCVLLAAWNGGDWLMSWGGGDIDGHILFLDLLVAAAGLYFQFQLLTDLAGLAELHRPSEDNDLDARVYRSDDRRLAVLRLPAGTGGSGGGVVVLGGAGPGASRHDRLPNDYGGSVRAAEVLFAGRAGGNRRGRSINPPPPGNTGRDRAGPGKSKCQRGAAHDGKRHLPPGDRSGFSRP